MARAGAYLRAMTTYTTPHFATGVSDSNLRSEPSFSRTRPASAATYRTAGVSNEAAALAEGPTPDWQPGVATKGMPKAAIGALGAALVGGVALAFVLLSPSNKVTKQVMPDPIAQAAAQTNAAQKTTDSAQTAVDELNKNAPAAGNVAAATAAASAAAQQNAATTDAPSAAVTAPVQAAVPDATPPAATVPAVHAPRHAKVAAPVVTPRVDPQPVQSSAPVVTPDAPATPAPADVQPPAMQQTPDAPTVTPSVPTPAPTPDTPAPDTTPAPTPAPAQ